MSIVIANDTDLILKIIKYLKCGKIFGLGEASDLFNEMSKDFYEGDGHINELDDLFDIFENNLINNIEKVLIEFINISEKNNKKLIAFNLYVNYFNFLLRNGDLKKAESIVIKMKNSYKWNPELNNLAISYGERFLDREILENAINQIDEKFQKNRFQIIEILGFFVAITAFIFSGVEILKTFTNMQEAKKLLLIIAYILFIFEFIFILFSTNWNKELAKTISIALILLYFIISLFCLI